MCVCVCVCVCVRVCACVTATSTDVNILAQIACKENKVMDSVTRVCHHSNAPGPGAPDTFRGPLASYQQRGEDRGPLRSAFSSSSASSSDLSKQNRRWLVGLKGRKKDEAGLTLGP